VDVSAAQVLEQIDKLPFAEQREVFEQLCVKFDESDDDLTPEQVAELDRRAEDALAHPERCRPLDEVVADIEQRFRNRP
jgi:putative addiction module component (TIGR02574 family)